MKLHRSTRHGFTLVEIMIVVALIGLLASIAYPNYVKARGTSQRNACINNLRQIDGAMQQWALEFKMSVDHSVTLDDVTPFLKSSITCQAGGTTIYDSYEVSQVSQPPVCKSPGGGSVNGHILPE